jgi:hypothetical protein
LRVIDAPAFSWSSKMALFFFDIRDGASVFSDLEGCEADDLASARRLGRQALQESMRDNVDDDAARAELRMTILDADRLPVWVLTVTVSSAEPPRPN